MLPNIPIPDAPIEWILLGIVIFAVEFLAPGLILLFFGLAAIAVGIISFIYPFSFNIQLTLFITLSILSLIGLRRRFISIFKGKTTQDNADIDDISGTIVTVIAPITPDHPGRVEFRGSHWIAISTDVLYIGDSAQIIRQDNISLIVKQIKQPGDTNDY